MRKFQLFVFGSVFMTLATISMIFLPWAGNAEEPKTEAPERPRMQRMMGAERPWITIALKHQSELNLSPEQIATLEKIRTQHLDQATPIREQLRTVEGEIAAALQDTPANLIQAKLAIEKAEKLRAELRYLRVEALENGKSVLTAEQREQLKNLRPTRHPRFQKEGQAS